MYRFCVLLSIFFFIACSGNTIENEKTGEEVFTLYLVRHAEKAKDGSNDPSLNAIGQARATSIISLLEDKGLKAVYTTPYKRTRETASPLAEKLNLSIQEYTPHDSTFVNKTLLRKAQTAFIVGHSNTIPALVNQLVGANKYQQLDEMEYDKLFKVLIEKEVVSDEVIRF